MRRAPALALAALALALPARAQAQVDVPGTRTQPTAQVRILGAERTGDRVVIRIATDAVTGAAPSEPFHLGGGRTRVFITLHDAVLAERYDSVFPSAGMLALRADGYNGNVRVTADVAGLGEYGVEPTEEGLALWLELARPASAAVATIPPPGWQERAGELVATVSAEIARLSAQAGPALSMLAARTRALAEGTAATPVRIALFVTLLLVTFAAWRVATAHTAPRRARAPEPAAAAGDPRIRSARALAGDGLGADEIARRTGIARDVAALLVRRPRPEKAADPGTKFRARSRGGSPGDKA